MEFCSFNQQAVMLLVVHVHTVNGCSEVISHIQYNYMYHVYV